MVWSPPVTSYPSVSRAMTSLADICKHESSPQRKVRFMLRNTHEPHVFRQSNGDGTDEVVAGDFSPFNVIVISNGSASVEPSVGKEYDNHMYYSFGAILPSDATVTTA